MKEFKKLVSAFLVVAMVVTLVTITPVQMQMQPLQFTQERRLL